MVAGCGIYARWVFRYAGIRLADGQPFLSLLNYRSLLFASVVGGSDFVQGMVWRGVSWNRKRWVVGNQVMS